MKTHFHTLRPVGNPICLASMPLDHSYFGNYKINFYQSGTAALAASLLAARHIVHEDKETAEVLLPAYACPDLISACLHAGVSPVLVDLEPNSCRMSIRQIEESITPRTIAIIAVKFLGIAEHSLKIQQICQANKLLFIEDSAQGFPLTSPNAYWQGDMVVLSFGRGKPVNMLGGGALLYKAQQSSSDIPAPPILKTDLQGLLHYHLKVLSYNTLIHPLVYGLAIRIPGIRVGETVYKELGAIEGININVMNRLGANIKSYRQTSNSAIRIRDQLQKLGTHNIIDLPSRLHHDYQDPLLRYPIIFPDMETRNRAFSKLAPYGASLMYKNPLPKIDTLPRHLDFIGTHYENAADFADRLLTLPTHSAVDKMVISKIIGVIGKFA